MKSNKKFLSLILSLTLGATLLTGCSGGGESSGSSDEVKKIGITQLVEHPALDQAREGFIEGLKENGFVEGENLEVDFQNAQNDNPTSQTIASNFANDKKDLIFAVSTPSAQAALNATQDIPIVFTAVTDAVEAGLVKSNNFANDKKDLIFAVSTPSAQAALNATQDIPIVFTAVTDAVEAGLVKSNESSENNVTGTSDAIPVDKSLELIKKFVPNVKTIGVVCNTSEINSKLQVDALRKAAEKEGIKVIDKGATQANEVNQAVKTIGVVCNTSEINSKLQVDALRKAAEKEGIKVIDKGATQANEVNQAVAAVAKEADVIFTPTDNLVASSMPIITKVATENKIPVIGSEEGHVENGALACNGISYKELGKKAGEMAAQILKGEKQPSELPVATLEETETIINKSTMETLGIKDPQIENATFK